MDQWFTTDPTIPKTHRYSLCLVILVLTLLESWQYSNISQHLIKDVGKTYVFYAQVLRDSHTSSHSLPGCCYFQSILDLSAARPAQLQASLSDFCKNRLNEHVLAAINQAT